MCADAGGVLVDHVCVESAQPGTRHFTCPSVLLFFLGMELEVVVVVCAFALAPSLFRLRCSLHLMGGA